MREKTPAALFDRLKQQSGNQAPIITRKRIRALVFERSEDSDEETVTLSEYVFDEGLEEKADAETEQCTGEISEDYLI